MMPIRQRTPSAGHATPAPDVEHRRACPDYLLTAAHGRSNTSGRSPTWQSSELWQAPRASRRLTAAAGSAAQVAFGIGLLASAGSFRTQSRRWCMRRSSCRELCTRRRRQSVSSAEDRWPCPFWADLERSIELAGTCARHAAGDAGPLLIAALQFGHGVVRAYLSSLVSGSCLMPLLLALVALPAISRRVLLPQP
jgi:hypothetical protein